MVAILEIGLTIRSRSDGPDGPWPELKRWQSMKNLVLTLDPDKLQNPDLDLRYVIPDLLSTRSDGNIKDNGYDYEDQESKSSPLLAIFLIATDFPAALKTINQLVLSEEVLGNNLSSAATLYIEEKNCRAKIPLGESLA